jgi:HEAT repeat protein
MNRIYIKFISVVLSLAMVITSADFGYGSTLFKTTSHAQRHLVQNTAIENTCIVKDPYLASIPQSLGAIVEHFKGDKDSLIIHIQDKHIDPTAQSNIAGIIDEFISKHKVSLMCLEGASAELDTSFYDAYEDNEIKHKVSKAFVDFAIFTGAEYYKITNKDEYLIAVGAEDKGLYLKHLDIYKNTVVYQESIINFLKAVNLSLNNLKGNLYTKDLKSIDSASISYSKGAIKLSEYIKTLNSYANKAKIDTPKYPDLIKFIALVQREEKIDFKLAETQRETIIKKLSETLDRVELNELLRNSMDFRADKLSQEEFYDYLFNLIDKYDFKQKEYSQLQAYRDYIKLSKAINHLKVFDEADDFEYELMIALSSTQPQKDLILYSKSAKLLQGLYSLKLTPRQLHYLEKHKGSSDIGNIKRFLITTSSQYGLHIPPIINSFNINSYIMEQSKQYYSLALERDTALIENTLQRMRRLRNDKAILVAGGFHTQGITNILKEKGISYVVICPNICQGDYDAIYNDRITGKLPTIEQIESALSDTLVAPLIAGDITSKASSSGVQNLFAASVKTDSEAEIKEIVRKIMDKILAIGHAFNRWQEKYEFQKQLVSLGKEAIPPLLGILRNSQNSDEKAAALDIIKEIGDERAIDTLVDILSNNPDSYGPGSAAAHGLVHIGKAASPRLKTLLNTHGPRRNILLAIGQLKDESFVSLLRDLQTDDNYTKRLIASTLLILGEKRGLTTLITLFELYVKSYRETKEESTLIFIKELLSNLSGSMAKNSAKTILKTDSSLENRLATAAKDMIDLIGDGSLTQELIKLFGLGDSDSTAKILGELYAQKCGNETLGRTIALAMKEVGSACIPYLIQGYIKNDLMFEILGDIGDASAVPFLLRELKEVEYSDYNRRKTISKAINKIGEKAAPYLLEMLEKEKEDNDYICMLLVDIKSSIAIPKMIELLQTNIPDKNKLNLIKALGYMEPFGHCLSTALSQDPLLRRPLFDLTIAIFKDYPKYLEYRVIKSILKITATNEDVSKLIDLYQQNGTEVKKVILDALAGRTDEATITFLISVFSSPDTEMALESLGALKASLEALNSLGKSGMLFEYLKRSGHKQEELIGLLETKVQISTNAMAILGIIGTERCLAILIKELDRKIQQNLCVDTTLLETLMAIGGSAKALLHSAKQLDLVTAIDRIATESLLAPLSHNMAEEAAKDIMARTLKKWLVFIAGEERVKRPITRQELIATYLSQREQITNLIIKMKEYLAGNPDAVYEEILKLIKEDMENLSVRAQARFRIGVINYIRDRERVRRIMAEAAKAGLKNGDLLIAADIQKDRQKVQFVIDILGFLPKIAQVFFLSDTIHIRLDSESYGRMRYRQKTHVMGAADEYSKLLTQEKLTYQDSGGVFILDQHNKVGETRLSGLFTFENLPFLNIFLGIGDGHTLVHEVQHRFFHSYAEDELKEALLLRRAEAIRLIEVINSQTGEQRQRSINKVRDALTMITLFDYQNEMISKIIDGNWIKDKDITSWFEFYKQGYMDNVKEVLDKVNDVKLRQSMLEKVFGKAEEILKNHKPVIDKVITLKAQFIEREEKVEHKLAIEKANVWVATFLQTVPATRFNRLNWLAEKLQSEPGVSSAKSASAGIAIESLRVSLEALLHGIQSNPHNIYFSKSFNRYGLIIYDSTLPESEADRNYVMGIIELIASIKNFRGYNVFEIRVVPSQTGRNLIGSIENVVTIDSLNVEDAAKILRVNMPVGILAGEDAGNISSLAINMHDTRDERRNQKHVFIVAPDVAENAIRFEIMLANMLDKFNRYDDIKTKIDAINKEFAGNETERVKRLLTLICETLPPITDAEFTDMVHTLRNAMDAVAKAA